MVTGIRNVVLLRNVIRFIKVMLSARNKTTGLYLCTEYFVVCTQYTPTICTDTYRQCDMYYYRVMHVVCIVQYGVRTGTPAKLISAWTLPFEGIKTER